MGNTGDPFVRAGMPANWRDLQNFYQGRGASDPYATQPGQPSGTQNFGGYQMGNKAPPKPPDFYGAAQATSQGSQQAVGQQTMQNRPFQFTPFASQGWSIDPKTGAPVQNTQLAGGLGQAATGLEGQIGAQAGTALPTGAEARDAAINQIYTQGTSRLDPMFQQRQRELEGSLAARGIEGTPQAAEENRQFNTARTDAYGNLLSNAQQIGMQAQGLNFAQDVTGRQLPYQQLGQLQGLAQMPSFTPAGQYKPADYLSAAAMQGGLNAQNFQAQQQKKGASGAGAGQGIGGLGMLGMAGAMAGATA